jgi:DNA-binding MarR family transcriptional regulator
MSGDTTSESSARAKGGQTRRELPPLRAEKTGWPLLDRPGFLIRRAHQLHVALFAHYCQGFEITPIQYSLLATLDALEQADQSRLAMEIGMDRTTTAGALKRLEARDLLKRMSLPSDRRAQFCVITPAGKALLAEMENLARTAHAQTIAALSPAEQYLLVQLLQKVIEETPVPEGKPTDG